MEDFLMQTCLKMLSIRNCFLQKNILLAYWLLKCIYNWFMQAWPTLWHRYVKDSSGKSWGEECYLKVCCVSEAGGTFLLAPILASLAKRVCFMIFSLSLCWFRLHGTYVHACEAWVWTKETWVYLFTCLSVRAIHLEWVLELTATQFLDCSWHEKKSQTWWYRTIFHNLSLCVQLSHNWWRRWSSIGLYVYRRY